ncbi:MAG: DUF4397 domain-containing protein [Gammaproteobacteria bacterium]
MRELRGFYAGMLVGGAVLLTAGCNEHRDTGAVTSKTDGATTSAPASETMEHKELALVRAVNAIPGGGVTIWAGDSVAFQSVAYKKATGYQEIPGDRFDFQLKASKDADALAHNREKLKDGGHYTIVAMPDEGGADKRNLRVLDDDLKPVSPDKARVRFINGVPSDTDVDVYIHGQKDAMFDGVNFKTEAGWDEVDPAAGTLEVRPDNKSNVLASLANVKLEGGQSYTFVMSGTSGKYELTRIEDTVAKEAN